MKRSICLILAAILLLCGCERFGQKTAAEQGHSIEVGEAEEVTIFPRSDCFIGDTMPYFENGYMNVFYLADLRDGNTGYHPWALMRTKDYCTYEDMGWEALLKFQHPRSDEEWGYRRTRNLSSR